MNFISKVKRFLWIYSGEDPQIIGSDTIDESDKNLFAFIGLFVLSIFFATGISIYLFVSNLFYSYSLDIFISATIALIFTNLYLLTLYTITPPLLPVQKSVIIQTKSFKFVNIDIPITEVSISPSLFFRLCILILLALFIAQPFNVIIFSTKPAHNEFAKEIQEVLASNSLTWIVNIICSILFLFPVYLKYLIRRNTKFYNRKQSIERRFVEDNYNDFLKLYSSILNSKANYYNELTFKRIYPVLSKLEDLNKNNFLHYRNQIIQELNDGVIQKYENYSNPPFNTQKKSIVTNYYSEKDFLNLIYNQE